MNRFRKAVSTVWKRALPVLNRAFVLPPLAILVLFPASMVLCIIALNSQGICPPLEYLAYLVSAYALAVFIIGLGSISEAAARLVHGSRIYRWVQKYPIAQLFISDRRFRGELSLYQGLLVSTLFAVFKGAAALFYRSVWFAAVAGYYITFGISRLLLVRNYRRSERLGDAADRRQSELRAYRQCGFLMLVLHLGMAAMAVQLIREEYTIAYPGSVIYITAAYSFYILTLSIVNIVRFRKLNSPILSASKALNLAGALMSIFTLQNAMTSRFANDVTFRRIMNLAVGLTVCACVLAMGIFMMVHSTRQLKRLADEPEMSI